MTRRQHVPQRSIATSSLPLLVISILSATPVNAQSAGPVFEDGEAQIVKAFSDKKDWIQHDLWVETEFDSDGDGALDRVHVDVTRQKQTDTEDMKVPVVYVTSPYFAGTASGDKKYFWDPKQELGTEPPTRVNPPEIPFGNKRPLMSRSHINDWVPRGYAVVHSASPGTGLSQGCPTVGGANEALAPKAVIDWLNGRARGFTSVDGDELVEATWTTGKVGMTGTSYNGTLPLAAATTGVDGLEAIIPIAPNTSYYHYYRSHGLIRHPGGWIGEDIDVLFDFIHSGNPERREWCNENVRDGLMLSNHDRVNGDYNDFWAGRDYFNQLGPLKAATLMSHAFNDWNVMPEHSVRIYEAIAAKGVPAQAFFHQGGHGGPPPMRMMNRWFTRYLFGLENGVEKDARAWIVREGEKLSNPTAYDNYPNPAAEVVTLYPSSGGGKNGELSMRQTRELKGSETLTDDHSIKGSELAKAKQSDNRLLYTTKKLDKPLHISGYAKLNIRVASSKPAANLSVWLVSLPWKDKTRIYENVITRGWADPQNHTSMTESEPLVPGKFYNLSFELQPDDHVVPVGQQIGLMIFSSDHEFTLWPEPGTVLTVDLNATSIELPIVGGQKAFTKAQ
ncbi:MAG: X-Pro dipeptidyl-peptidase [Planctomycetota bacterium]|jgi:X-Pro dipeptidyl-peptidase